MEQVVYLNGTLLPRSEAKISPFDHGFLYGFGLFETMRAYSGHVFRLDRHLARLSRCAELLDMPLDASVLEAACYETLKANGLGNARIRITVSLGEGESTPDRPPQPKPTVFVVATPFVPPTADRYRTGFKVAVSSIRQNSQSPLSRLKSVNYLTCLLARNEAKTAGADEALLLNEHGSVCEGSTSNVFLIRGDRLVTPGLDSGCLPGITRQAVLDLSGRTGMRVEERDVLPEELGGCDEVFLTNSLLEIMPVSEVDRKCIAGWSEAGRPGRRTEGLMAAYAELVATETKSLP